MNKNKNTWKISQVFHISVVDSIHYSLDVPMYEVFYFKFFDRIKIDD